MVNNSVSNDAQRGTGKRRGLCADVPHIGDLTGIYTPEVLLLGLSLFYLRVRAEIPGNNLEKQ